MRTISLAIASALGLLLLAGCAATQRPDTHTAKALTSTDASGCRAAGAPMPPPGLTHELVRGVGSEAVGTSGTVVYVAPDYATGTGTTYHCDPGSQPNKGP